LGRTQGGEIVSDALRGFDRLKSWVDQLADIHRRIRVGRGRRHRQEALYRAGVVMTVAAWESYVEDVLNEAMAALDPGPAATAGERTAWVLACTSAKLAAKKFNTPNAQNVAALLDAHLGIDIEPSWTVNVNGTAYTAQQAKTRMNKWLEIRHKVAHGGVLPTDIAWIKSPSGTPRLTLALMNDCRDFFRALAQQTDIAIAAYLVNRFGLLAQPW